MAIRFLNNQSITGTLTISTIANASGNPNKFLGVNGNGRVDYVTGSQLRGYIGAGTGDGTVTSVTVQGNTGLSGSGTVTSTGTITLTNSDRGSSQNIFKNFTAGSGGTATANSNNDTLTITGSGGTTTSRSGDTITINSTDNNDNYYVTSASFNTSNGVLTLNRNGGLAAVTVDLDGRYLPLTGGTMTGVTQFNDHTQHGDQVQARWGAGNDLTIEHNATDSSITNITGDLYITNKADNKDILFRTDNGSGGFTTYLTIDGLNENLTFSKPAQFLDGVYARFGNSSDLQIYHDGSNSYINETGAGNLYITASERIRFQGANGEALLYMNENSNVIYSC